MLMSKCPGNLNRSDSKLLFLVAAFSMQINTVHAEGLLYDPEPPADSAYVRVVRATGSGTVALSVDGEVRVAKLESASASDYMVIGAGHHVLAATGVGRKEAEFSTAVNVIAGRAMTIAYTDAGKAPLIFEDKANANKLKAILAVYHLADKSGVVDIRSADGKVSVFSQLATNTSRSLMVNPIKITLTATSAGQPLASMAVDMKPGGTYSVLLLPAAHGAITARIIQNKVERYTGKKH
jgi:alginate O-acetyltransferase complex protein AlgF